MANLDEEAIEEAFERGRRVGQQEGMAFDGVSPFAPWTCGVEFSFAVSWFESFFSYERNVLVELRKIQHACWIERNGNQLTRLREHQRKVEVELGVVRQAVNEELNEGRGRRLAVEALRSSPQRPDRVREYPDVESFVREDLRRALSDWPTRRDAAGADFGLAWGLENPMRRWEVTRWRISWLGQFEDDPTNEVYAIEVEGHSPINQKRNLGRVWLLGTLPDWDTAMGTLFDPQIEAMKERNSLIVAARAVQSEEFRPSV